jgi:outer membrane immunogenic protein
LNAGGGWGKSNETTSTVFSPTGYFAATSVTDVNGAGAQSANTKGFTGGLQGGFNWQSGALVAGIELDFDYFGQKGSSTTTAGYSGFAPATFTINSSVKTDWLFTARPRLGVATSNWLLYGTGGLAVTKLKADWTFTDNCCVVPLGATESASASATKTGFIIGAGVETALPGKLSFGVEFLRVKFGSISATSNNLKYLGTPIPASVFSHSADLTSNIVRVRLNKLF